MCQNIRIPRFNLLGAEAYRGPNASKRAWFHGFKGQILATTDGVPVAFYVHAGSEADITGLRVLAPDLPTGSVLHTDAGHTDYAGEDLCEEATGHWQQTARKGNSTRPHAPHETFLLQHLHKTIETTFKQLTVRFPKQIHAVTAQGVVVKIAVFIFVHTLDQVGL